MRLLNLLISAVLWLHYNRSRYIILSEIPVITLMGPTASGKTALAMALYDRFPVDIISVDSALIYRDMDIGTAKPSSSELAVYPHQLVDICDPAERYSAATFQREAIEAIERSLQARRIPLLVGGTMLYFKALLEGLSPLPVANQEIRQAIEQKAQDYGWVWLHAKLAEIDPIAAQRIHPNDLQRLTRALEVYRISGVTLTELIETSGNRLPYKVHQFAVAPDKDNLHRCIETRFHSMLTMGFEGEVARLKARGDLNPTMPSVRCVGYRQMWAYLDGEMTHDEMIFRAIIATKQLAKRQMTWLRGWSNITWLNSLNNDQVIEIIQKRFAI